MDAGYGNDTELRTDITALGLRYVAGIGPTTSVWPPGEAPVPPQSRTGRGRPQTRLQRGPHQPISVKTLALSLPPEAWQTITWREGTADWLSSRFARRRVRPAHRDNLLSEVRAEVASDRVAGRRNRADQILVFDLARRCRLRSSGRSDQVAMADRARLSGAQAGTGPWRL